MGEKTLDKEMAGQLNRATSQEGIRELVTELGKMLRNNAQNGVLSLFIR